jgi:peptide-methionine (S)-S-oxide reductase
MIQRPLAIAFGLAVLLGLTGVAQAQSRVRKPPDQAGNAETKPAAGEDAPKDAPADSSQAKEDNSSDSKSSSAKKRPKPLERATFGGGCFWCMEAVFERIPGVKNVVSGYAGGHVPNPSYEMVCTGLTGHAEVVQITYDPNVLPFGKLLGFFWTAHDPTTLNSQGPDFGTQYRSIILYHNEAQREEARKQYRELMAHRKGKSPIVTELVPFTEFYAADAYHQDYYRNHPEVPYSQTYIEPKLRKLRQKLRAH